MQVPNDVYRVKIFYDPNDNDGIELSEVHTAFVRTAETVNIGPGTTEKRLYGFVERIECTSGFSLEVLIGDEWVFLGATIGVLSARNPDVTNRLIRPGDERLPAWIVECPNLFRAGKVRFTASEPCTATVFSRNLLRETLLRWHPS